mgnify:CR=1 FL=1
MEINVLVVDDSSVMRAMISKTMGLSGLSLGKIYQAANGQEGLDVLSGHWIDLIIADINMPVMNGEEMIDRIRANPELKDISIIIISTEGSDARIDRLRRKGAAFIHKPFTPETIRDTVKDMMKLGDSDEGTD